MKNYISSGETIPVASAGRTASSGAGILTGQIFGFLSDDVASGAACEVVTQGVFDGAKDTSTFSVGDKVYWDNTAFLLTSTSTSNKYVGAAVLAALTGDATVRVRLNPTTVI